MTSPAISLSGLLAAAALLGLVVVASLVPVDIGDTPVAHALWDAGHFPLFAVLAIGLELTLSRGGSRRYFLAGFLSLVAAILIEVVQPAFGRTASVGDLIRGSLGVAVALVGVHVWRHGGVFTRVLHGATTLMIVVALLLPVWHGWRAVRWRVAHYPLLADFEDSIEMRLWFSQGGSLDDPTAAWRSEEWSGSGDHALKIRKASGGWPGVYYSSGPMDWSEYTTFSFELFNPGEAFELRLRIDDESSRDSTTRFGKHIPVPPGFSQIRVAVQEIQNGPAARPLDTSRIRRFLLFTGPDDPPRVFFLDEVRLLDE